MACDDCGISCNLQPGNQFWIGLVGDRQCATYDLKVTTLAQNHSYCSTGEYQMQHDPAAMAGGDGGELVPERMTYGSCRPGSIVD